MTIQRLYHGFCLAAGLIVLLTGTQATIAETFSFSLKGLGESDMSGDRMIRGRMTVGDEKSAETQIMDFEMSHGDRGDQQTLDFGIRNQGESVLEAVFDIFGLSSRSERGSLDANISGDINPADSELNVDLGEDMPGMRINIKTPQD